MPIDLKWLEGQTAEGLVMYTAVGSKGESGISKIKKGHSRGLGTGQRFFLGCPASKRFAFASSL